MVHFAQADFGQLVVFGAILQDDSRRWAVSCDQHGQPLRKYARSGLEPHEPRNLEKRHLQKSSKQALGSASRVNAYEKQRRSCH